MVGNITPDKQAWTMIVSNPGMADIPVRVFALCVPLVAPASPPLLPVARIILDNRDSQAVRFGTWCVSKVAGFYGTDAEYSCGESMNVFRWNVSVPVQGNYDVFVRWTADPNRSSRVPIVVRHASGEARKEFNQQTAGGQWVLHGRYQFRPGTDVFVVLSNANGPAVADAVQFVFVPNP